MLRAALLSVLSLLFVSLPMPPLAAQSGRTPVTARHGMVVSDHALASEVGAEVLRQGGNAVDAAVATAFALAVTLPSAGNIGGGGFLVYYGADGYATSFDFREKAPLAATDTMFATGGEVRIDTTFRGQANHVGPLSVGVPGTVAGLWMAHQRLGRLPWSELVAPAVRLADEGFPVSWDMQWFFEWVADNADTYASTAKVFLKPDGTPYEPGEVWRQPDLARTLRRIQQDGRDGFYRGETARLLVDYMRSLGGLITEEDLARYEAVEQPPVHGTFRGYDVYSIGPPSSGGVVLVEMLNILEGYDLRAIGHNGAFYLHLLTEAMRRAYADRAEHLGDPAFNPDMPVERLTSKEYAVELRATIDPHRASKSDPAAFNQAYESMETTHLSVVDAEGNAVSLTYTLENAYGARLVVEGAGFLLNDEMGDFNPVPGRTDETGLIGTPPNLVAPGKRMLSSMTPTIVARDGRPVLVVGSPGGRTIINTVLQVVLNVIEHGMNVGQAIEAGRIHHAWLPDVTTFERWAISPDTRRLYEQRGHRIRFTNTQGRAMGIYVDHETGLRYGAADSRSPTGGAVGF